MLCKARITDNGYGGDEEGGEEGDELNGVAVGLSDHVFDIRLAPEKEVEQRDSLNWVGKIIEDLPEQQKMVIQLRDIEQYELDEICKMLDMHNTAVRVALSRARKTIREKLTNTHSYGIK